MIIFHRSSRQLTRFATGVPNMTEEQEYCDRLNAAWKLAREPAQRIGDLLQEMFPVPDPSPVDCPCIPKEHAEVIAETLTAVIAEILQSWLDAGSERDSTMEELFDPIHAHLRGWAA